MVTILIAVGAILLVAIVTILILASRKPDEFRVTRSLAMKAPAEKIYPQIADLHAWAAWSPYEKRDPAMQRTFSRTDKGLGAVYDWKGNKNVGTGRMEVIETASPSRILFKLDFFKPFKAHNKAEFTMTPAADGTVVTWSMYGPAIFMTKVMGLFCNMDKMCGGDFAAGLANLKTIVERA